MVTSAGSEVPTPAGMLAQLHADVVRARGYLAAVRRAPLTGGDRIGTARSEVLAALEAYTAALESQQLPVPYALRDELRLHQRVRR